MRSRRLAATIIGVLLALTGCMQAIAQDAPALQDKDFVAVCGDSITEQKQYSVFIEDYLLMCRPAAQMRVMQAGWGGEVVHGFISRVDRDVLALNPTVVTTCYGMNDGGYGGFDEGRAKLYRDTHKSLVAKLRGAGVRMVVLGSPGVVDSGTFRGGGDPAELYNETLRQFSDIVREVAAEENVIFADVHTPMMEAMAAAKAKYGAGYHLAGGDGVHPWQNGQLVMAYAFLKALGCDGDIGTITLDLTGGKAQATDGHEVLSCAGGAVELESTRYPFCFFGNPADPSATSGVIEFIPFSDELNRLRLVVTGADAAARYNVTWGAATKEFTGAALAEGINLAAEFIDNPFCQPFQAVEKAIREQQQYETSLTKVLLHYLPSYRDLLPEENAALDQIAATAIERDAALAAASSAAVVPVKHLVKVEAVQ